MELFTDSQQALDERSAQLRVTSENLASTKVVLTETQQDLTTTTMQREEKKYLVEEHVKTEGLLLQEAEQVFKCPIFCTVLMSCMFWVHFCG